MHCWICCSKGIRFRGCVFRKKETYLVDSWLKRRSNQESETWKSHQRAGYRSFCVSTFYLSHLFTPRTYSNVNRFRGCSPDCQNNTVIVTRLKLAVFFFDTSYVRVVGSSTDNEWTHPHGIKETFASTARLSLVTGRKQNPTFTWWLRASRGGAGTSRPSRSFPLLSVSLLLGYLSSCIREPLWRSTRGSQYLEKPWGRVLAKIWERPGTTFLVSSRRSRASEDQRSFASDFRIGSQRFRHELEKSSRDWDCFASSKWKNSSKIYFSSEIIFRFFF